MNVKRFFLYLVGVSLIGSALLLVFSNWSLTRSFFEFSLGSLLFFLLFTVAIYFVALRAARQVAAERFVQAVIGILAAKLFLCALLILIYHRSAAPESRWFLLPFFSFYLIYTIFETYFLMRLSRQSGQA